MLPVVCCRSDIASSDAIFQRSFRRIRVIDFERSTILYHFHAFEISNGARGSDLKFKSMDSIGSLSKLCNAFACGLTYFLGSGTEDGWMDTVAFSGSDIGRFDVSER